MNFLLLLSLWGRSVSHLDWAAVFGTPRPAVEALAIVTTSCCHAMGEDGAELRRLSTLPLTARVEAWNLGSETTPGTWKLLSYLSVALLPGPSLAGAYALCFL